MDATRDSFEMLPLVKVLLILSVVFPEKCETM